MGFSSGLVLGWFGGGGFFVVVFPFFESQSCFEKLQHTTEIRWCCADSFVLFLKGVRLSTFCNFFHSAFPSFSILLIFKLKGQSRVFQRAFFCLHVYKYFWGKGVTEGGFINGRLRKNPTSRDGALSLRFVLLFNFPYSEEDQIKAFKQQLRLLRGGELQPGASQEVRERGKV